MSDNNFNPFKPTRWEHQPDGKQLIWFTPDANRLIGSKSTFIYGNRGSGKTTLLRSICWEDLTSNKSLMLQKKILDFDHIGFYVRFPDHISATFSEKIWGRKLDDLANPELHFHSVFSLLIECACIERLFDALHHLRLSSDITFSAESELVFVKAIIDEFPKINYERTSGIKTLTDLARTVRQLSRTISELFGRGDLDALFEVIPPRQPNEILDFVARAAQGFVRINDETRDEAPNFKFCFDDCEVLDKFQRKSLNSLVRQSRAPVSWVVASVGKSKWAGDTFINSQPLTDADRNLIALDRRDREDFSTLCEAVASLRLLFSQENRTSSSLDADSMKKFFSFEERLGTSTVNSIMMNMVNKSKTQVAKDVYSGASLLKQETTIKNADLKPLPLYEAYILMHWMDDKESFISNYNPNNIGRITKFADSLYKNESFSAWLRRKQVNALLQFSVKTRQHRMPLEGANLITSVADGSIRDFLEILAEVFDEYVENLPGSEVSSSALVTFSDDKSKISSETQSRGIYRASEKYFQGISNRFDVEGDLLSRLIGGLAHLTSILQSSPTDSRVLAFAERGLFLFEPPKGTQPFTRIDEDVRRALRQAELAGYLRPILHRRMPKRAKATTDPTVMAYRLHKRFAPIFRFSYRGAYEPFRIEYAELYELLLSTERGSALRWAEKMAGISDRYLGTEQYLLPFDERIKND